MNDLLAKSIYTQFPSVISSEVEIRCDDGWYQLIIDLFKILDLGQVKVISIKEKFGKLSVYTNSNNPLVEHALDYFSRRSAYICEVCGEPANLHLLNKYLLKAICQQHYKELQETWFSRSVTKLQDFFWQMTRRG